MAFEVGEIRSIFPSQITTKIADRISCLSEWTQKPLKLWLYDQNNPGNTITNPLGKVRFITLFVRYQLTKYHISIMFRKPFKDAWVSGNSICYLEAKKSTVK